MAFLPPQPENAPHVKHKNFVGSDNNVNNLQWSTARELCENKGYTNQNTYCRSVSKFCDNVLVKEYTSMSEAATDSDATIPAIIQSCREGCRAGGFYWQYTASDAIENEEWRTIDYPPTDVSNLGRVKRANGTITYGFANTAGYRVYVYNGRKFGVHQLVAKAFHGPPPPGMSVDHIDRDKSNNNESNLRYATASQQAINQREARPISQFTLAGDFITTFPSVLDAADTLKIRRGAIYHCLQKAKKSGAGFVWKYAAECQPPLE
jgi:hypothetical protein